MSAQKIKEALRAHRASEQALEREVEAILGSDYLSENERLRHELATLEARVQAAESALPGLKAENQHLKSALSEQILSERATFVNSAESKLNTMFREETIADINRLRQLEVTVQTRLQTLRKYVQSARLVDEQAILGDVSALENKVHDFVKTTIAAQPATAAVTEEEHAQFESLKNEPLTDAQIAEIAKKNSIETFIGLNLINKLGVLLVVIGVIAASRYTLLLMPDLAKGALMFLLGGLLLLCGELLSRRSPSVVSLGITAGGVAVLYVALSVSYFMLRILSAYPAIAVCILITAASFLLSRRYSSQTIACFALIGGYLPLLAVGGDTALLYPAMAYFLVLNLLALLLSLGRRWEASAFIGFVLNFIGTYYLSYRTLDVLSAHPFGMAHVALLAYLFCAFFLYTLLPVLRALRTREALGLLDIALLSLDVVLGATLLYVNLYALSLGQFAGLLTLLLAICYVCLGRLMETRFARDEHGCLLFYLAGLTFAVLVVPFQFGRIWLSLGWLAEGTVLAVYGILKNDKLLRRFGYAVCGLCLSTFLCYDLMPQIGGLYLNKIANPLFPWQYLAMTLASLAIGWAFSHVKAPRTSVLAVYHTCVATNLWFYLLYLCYKATLTYCGGLSTAAALYGLLPQCLGLCVTIAVALLLQYKAPKEEPALRILSLILYDFAAVWCLIANIAFRPLRTWEMAGSSPHALGIAALVLVNVLAVFALRQMLYSLVNGRQMDAVWYPLTLSAFSLLLLTEVLTVQLNLAFASLSISLLYAAAAIAWIAFGFARRYALMRRFGLGLAVFSVAKLFLLDLYTLTEGYRILSYFALGVSLIAISFLYQHFSRRFVLSEQEEANDEKTD